MELPGNSIAEASERSILGGIIIDEFHLEQVREVLTPEMFGHSCHRLIFKVMCEMHDDGRPIDSVTLDRYLRDAGRIHAVGGHAYLASLTELLPRRLKLEPYARDVWERARRRDVKLAMEEISTRLDDYAISSAEIVAEVIGTLENIASDTPRGDMPSIADQTADAWADLQEEHKGKSQQYFSYGIKNLDELIGGLTKGEMTILGGRAGMGKSSGGNQLIARHCPGGTGVFLATTEMTSRQTLRRLWATVSGVPFYRTRRSERLSAEEMDRLREASLCVAQWPLHMDTSENVTVDDICIRAKAAKRKHGVEIVIVDYLQRLRYGSDLKHQFKEVGIAAKKLANLAKKENLAVLVLSSLTDAKDAKKRDEPPTLANLRESGDIQYEASTVLLLHRPHKDTQGEDLEDDGQIIIAKARSDETGVVNVNFDAASLQFTAASRYGTPHHSGLRAV